MTDPILKIQKANGNIVDYLPRKLVRSLERVGANEELIGSITSQVEDLLYPGIPTGKIYTLVYRELRKRSRPLAARYKLRKAIQELGPSGYPFEAYVGEIFRYLGYTVQVGISCRGHCIHHEVDVLADRAGRRIAIECKFGNSSSKTLDVKVPLYIRSRFDDLANVWHSQGVVREHIEGWIITNSSFSEDARRYGECAGLRLVSWDYPSAGSLKDLIEHSALYPVTVLASLTKAEKKFLLKQGIVLARQIPQTPVILTKLQLSNQRQKAALEEINGLCF